VGLPAFLLRKLYKKGSLRETADGEFAFRLQNPLGTATLIAPPEFVVNGVSYGPANIEAGGLDLAAISRLRPHTFAKGDEIELRFPGRLLRGGNRIHLVALTREFGEIEFLVEDREADYCEIPLDEEE
jgi:hypothetical protein